MKLEVIKKSDHGQINKEQSKLIFNGNLESCTIYDSYTFQQNEVLMDTSFYIGLAVSELSMSHMCESNYDVLQPNFGEKFIQLDYGVTDSFVLSVNTKITLKIYKTLKICLISAI